MDEQEGRECPKNPPRISEGLSSQRLAGLPAASKHPKNPWLRKPPLLGAEEIGGTQTMSGVNWGCCRHKPRKFYKALNFNELVESSMG